MKPLSPRAQRLLRSYRDQNALPHDVRARLLARLAQLGTDEADASRPQRAASRPPAARRLLRVLRYGGPAALLLIALAFVPRAPSDAPAAREVAAVATRGSAPLPEAVPARAQEEEPPSPSPAPAARQEVVRRARIKARSTSAPIKAVEVSAAGQLELEPPREAPATPRAPAAPSSHGGEPLPRSEASALDSLAPAQASASAGSASVASYEARSPDKRPRAELSLDDEVMLVRRASELLRAGDPMRALSALAEHARLFPAGKLVTMRQAARVQALCDLGRREQARGEAAIFLAHHGDSPYAAKVRQLCAAK